MQSGGGRGGNRALGLGVLLLGYRIMQTGLQHIPPVTLILTMIQAGLYLGFLNPPWTSHEVCLSAHHVLGLGDYRRLMLAAVEHSDDMHLYYNMASLLMKGRALEARFGARKFLILLLVLTASSSLCYVGLLEAAARYVDPTYRMQCAIGFSGVLFAMKVLTSHYDSRGGIGSSRSSSILYSFNVSLPTRYAVWVELLLIHLLVPRSSFVGHLAGILVGLAYVTGPLELVVDAIDSVLGSVFGGGMLGRGGGGGGGGGGRHHIRRGWGPSYTYAHGTAGSSRAEAEQGEDRESYDATDPHNTTYSHTGREYRSYSRQDFNPTRGFTSEAGRSRTQPSAPREMSDDIGWNTRPSYTYASGTPNDDRGSASHHVPDSSAPTAEELRQRRLRRFD